MAHHGIDIIYLVRNCNDFLVERGLITHLALSNAIGHAWMSFISGDEPWSGAAAGKAVHFGKGGVERVPREEVWVDVAQQERMRMWSGVSLADVGRIANLWMSEQDSRDEGEDFVY